MSQLCEGDILDLTNRQCRWTKIIKTKRHRGQPMYLMCLEEGENNFTGEHTIEIKT